MGLEPGDELRTLKVTPDKYLTVRYAGASGDYNPIHIDEEFARQVGRPGCILHGLYSMAQVARAQTDAGGGPQALRRLKVQFRGMGLPEHELTVTGEVTEVADGIAAITERDGKGFFVFESVSRNQRGETVCVGRWTNIVRGG